MGYIAGVTQLSDTPACCHSYNAFRRICHYGNVRAGLNLRSDAFTHSLCQWRYREHISPGRMFMDNNQNTLYTDYCS